MPAAFTRTSTPPNRASTASPIPATASGALTSHGNTATRSAASDPARTAVSASASVRRPTSATPHPSAANRRAIALPTPLPAPVTTATFIGRNGSTQRDGVPAARHMRVARRPARACEQSGLWPATLQTVPARRSRFNWPRSAGATSIAGIDIKVGIDRPPEQTFRGSRSVGSPNGQKRPAC
jgi:hypothetical protein